MRKGNEQLKTGLIVAASAAVVGVAVWFVSQRIAEPGMPTAGAPFTYDIEAAGRIDPSLIRWEEARTIPLELTNPRGLAVAQDDTFYVVGDSNLVKVAANGDLLSRVVLHEEPYCVAVDDDGTVFIGMRDHIEVMGLNAETTLSWAGRGEKAMLTSVALTEKAVFVADAGNREVLRYDRSGTLFGRISGQGAAGFIVPSPFFDLAVGPDDALWVVDPGRHAFKQFRADGELVSEWARTSMGVDGFCGCCNPTHIAIAADGSFVTSEKGLVRVKVHEPTGVLRSVVAGPDSFDEGTVGLDLALDSRGRIVVLDPKRCRLRIFKEERE